MDAYCDAFKKRHGTFMGLSLHAPATSSHSMHQARLASSGMTVHTSPQVGTSSRSAYQAGGHHAFDVRTRALL